MRSRKGAVLLKPPQLFNVKNDYFNLNQFEWLAFGSVSFHNLLFYFFFQQLCVHVVRTRFCGLAPCAYGQNISSDCFIGCVRLRGFFLCVVDFHSTANTFSFSFSLASSLCAPCTFCLLERLQK